MTTKQSTVSETGVETTIEPTLTAVHWGTLGLAVITGAIHLYLYATESWLPFLLAGAGFLGAVGLFFLLEDYRRYLYLFGIPFTLAQIGGYLLLPMGPLWLGVVDKVVQVAFVAALAYLYLNERDRVRGDAPVEER